MKQTDDETTDASTDEHTGWDGLPTSVFGTDRRSVLKALGASIAVGTTMTGAASAGHRSKGSPHLDPTWGYTGLVDDPSEGLPSPEDFPPQLRPDHVVELEATEQLPPHFHQAGLHITPGDVVLFQFHSPDHSVTAYHEGFRGGQRVPEGAAPFSSPVLPAGGYWIYRFGEAGVYDLFCAPHEFIGMVMRIVAHDGEDDAPPGYGDTHGPSPVNLLNYLKEVGLADANPPVTFPSSLDALTSDSLEPATIIEEGVVHYSEVFAEFNTP